MAVLRKDDDSIAMTTACLFFSIVAALGIYLSSRHQRLWLAARAHLRVLRVSAWGAAVLATTAAIAALGLWAGMFATLTAMMLGLVLLPPLDAWRQQRREKRRVG